MQFGLFMYCTVGRREELAAGMAGQNNALYQRMLDEIAEYARFADQNGYFGFGHPEHHLQIEGFEHFLQLLFRSRGEAGRKVRGHGTHRMALQHITGELPARQLLAVLFIHVPQQAPGWPD